MAKFVANNNKSAFTTLSPFFTSKNLYPRISFDIVNFSDITTSKQVNKGNAINILEVVQSIWKFA